jgi:hypothetical protein
MTAYQLACGYVDVRMLSDTVDIKLWHEHGHYHVRRSDWNGNASKWLVSRTLTEARANMRKLAKVQS